MWFVVCENWNCCLGEDSELGTGAREIMKLNLHLHGRNGTDFWGVLM